MNWETVPVVRLLGDLIRIKSVNPAYDNGVSEAGVCDFLEERFRRLGLECWRQEVFPGRPNLLVRFPGRAPGRRLVLEAHTDTASVVGMKIPPFEPRVEGGRIYGRGACDTKGGLAAMSQALIEIFESGRKPEAEVWLAAVADEEFSFRGVVKLCEGLQADGALVAEPTGLRPAVASKGVVRWRIIVRGRAAHSSKPHLGVNAIVRMARVIRALEEDHERLKQRVHPLLGAATVNVGVIRGGVQVNFVPDRCEIEVDRRLLPGETVAGVMAGYQRVLDGLRAMDSEFDAEMESPMLVDEALETASGERVAVWAGEVLRGMGRDGGLIGVPFGSDASKLARQGVPSIIIGPGSIDQAHADVEWLELGELVDAVTFYREFVLGF